MKNLKNIVLGLIITGIILILLGVNMIMQNHFNQDNSKPDNSKTQAKVAEKTDIPNKYQYSIDKNFLLIYNNVKKDSIKLSVEMFDAIAIEKDSIWINPLGKYFDFCKYFDFYRIRYSLEQFANLQFNYGDDKDYWEIIEKNNEGRIGEIAIANLYEAWRTRIKIDKQYYDLIDRANKIIYDLDFIYLNMEFPIERGIGDNIGYPTNEITKKIYETIQKKKINLKASAKFNNNKKIAINKLKQICKKRYDFIKKYEWSRDLQTEINEIRELINNDYLLKILEEWLKVDIKDRWVWEEN
jgi:hypothetical protein